MDTKYYISKLLEAENSNKPLEDAITKVESDFNEKDAYLIQMGIVNAKVEVGSRIVGKKVGFTSKGMQNMFKISEPDFGHLFDEMAVNSGQIVDISKMIDPRVEGEIAFILKGDLKGPGITAADVYKATEAIMASIEIVDSRFEGWKITGIDSIADNAANSRFVLGNVFFDIKGIDLRTIGMYMDKNGELINSGTGIEVLGNPVNSIAWLANKLSKYGLSLNAGEIILSGAVTGATKVEKGDFINVNFDKLGSVSVKFV